MARSGSTKKGLGEDYKTEKEEPSLSNWKTENDKHKECTRKKEKDILST